MSPVFDSKQIFDSWDADNNQFSEGCLTVLDFQKIRQRLHFNGEQGDRYLTHGYPDRRWVFEGLLSAPDYDTLAAMIVQIQSYIKKADSLQNTYSPMSDSFGNIFPYAQIHSFHYLQIPQIRIDGGYVCRVRIDGCVLGMESEN